MLSKEILISLEHSHSASEVTSTIVHVMGIIKHASCLLTLNPPETDHIIKNEPTGQVPAHWDGEAGLHEGFCQNCILETKLRLLSLKGQNWFKPTSLKALSLGTSSIISLLHHLSSWIQSHFDISLTQSYIKSKRDMFKQRKYNKGGTFLQDLCKRKKKNICINHF